MMFNTLVDDKNALPQPFSMAPACDNELKEGSSNTTPSLIIAGSDLFAGELSDEELIDSFALSSFDTDGKQRSSCITKFVC